MSVVATRSFHSPRRDYGVMFIGFLAIETNSLYLILDNNANVIAHLPE